jgi:hypothetical protein
VFCNSDVKFIILDDVTDDVAEPCVMDIKIGRQTWDPEASLEKRKYEDVSGHYCNNCIVRSPRIVNTRAAQKVMPHIFFSRKLFTQTMKFAHSIPGCFLYTLFFHIISVYLYGLNATVKQGHACLPCTSLFPVHIAMSSLHKSCSHHLQTLCHAVHPSMAPKDENLLGQ